jgi:hypothetical protein
LDKEKIRIKKTKKEASSKSRRKGRKHLPKASPQKKLSPLPKLTMQQTTQTNGVQRRTLEPPHPPDADRLQVEQPGKEMVRKLTPRPELYLGP